MFIYLDEFYTNIKNKKKKIDINKIKNCIFYLKKNDTIFFLSNKLIYFIIYLIKHNTKYCVIKKCIDKIISILRHNISLFIYNTSQTRWLNIINIADLYNKTDDILKYFIQLYDFYLTKENCIENKKFYIIQAKSILGINIKNKRQLYKYLKLNIYDTIYYIDIIFSQIDIKYLSLNYIFDISS
tara:strand:+ start:1010 stop:1561 length:552 start_codon:yes stop_codon:yes gene_type:complete